MSIFEKATRRNLLFDGKNGGTVNVIDLWHLPLESVKQTCLYDIAKGLHAKLKTEEVPDFLRESRKIEDDLQLKYDVVRHVIETRKAEIKLAQDKAAAKASLDRMTEILAQKQDKALADLPVDELQKLIAEQQAKIAGAGSN